MVDKVNPAGVGVGRTVPPGDGIPGRTPQRSVLADEVYKVIKDGLLARRYAPGERLNLDRLARELHVSATPVRQALARLESEGLVNKEPFRGFTASMLLDSHGIEELYEFRLFVEPATAAIAAQHSNTAATASLTSIADPAGVSADNAHDPLADRMGQLDIDFHCGIAKLAGNRVVVENLERTYARMRLYSIYQRPGAVEQAADEHRLIVEAISRADPDAAEAAMRQHLLGARDRMRQAFDG